jgi:hypothetical protein
MANTGLISDQDVAFLGENDLGLKSGLRKGGLGRKN